MLLPTIVAFFLGISDIEHPPFSAPTLTASSPLDTQYPGVYDVKYNWYASLTDETPIYSGATYSPYLEVEDSTYKFYVRSFITESCEGEALEVSVKVNKQPAVSINSELESYCPDAVGMDMEYLLETTQKKK